MYINLLLSKTRSIRRQFPVATTRRCLAQLSANELRKRYTDYFVQHGHKLLPSSNIVLQNDPTLLFTNAGMVPFKQYFLNPDTAPFPQITSVQKCIRAGGKHNDLDQVGYTPRHHTFFEMLGNFSFGAYDKRAAIRMAWQFVREELQMPEHMLRVTVLETDDEAYDIWKNDIGIADPQKRIVRCGSKDNFWSMGNGAGPCGPSSEIFWDTQNPKYSENDEERWLEIWNLVFMQYYRTDTGDLQSLKVPCIDTGMGLERVVSVLQRKHNNYDTDLFQKTISQINRLQIQKAGAIKPTEDTSLACKRIIADHLRSSVFLISEGVYPSNTGRGYVLRRIIRRAVRAGRVLGIQGSILPKLYPSLVDTMGAEYPELRERQNGIVAILESEEKVFLNTLGKGMALLEGIFARSGSKDKTVSGEDAFVLYDTHGFPIDLTEIIAREQGWTVDVEAFGCIQKKTRQRNKSSWKDEKAARSATAGEIQAICAEWQGDTRINSIFNGYELHSESTGKPGEVKCKVVASKQLTSNSQEALVVIDPCPFYAAGGGQVSDTGILVANHGTKSTQYAVRDAVALPNGQATVLHVAAMQTPFLLRGNNGQEEQQLPQTVIAIVDRERRLGNTVHHTATHILNAALRKVVGNSVMQAGSLVHDKGLRFDFTSSALTGDQLREIEQLVNKAALEDIPVTAAQMSLEEAKAQGAVALFTEKYNTDSVRVISVPGVSMELCGGTHLRSTRAVFPFHITSEGSIGAGTRRVEAVAGTAGAQWLQQQLGYARETAQTLGQTQLSGMNKKVYQLLEKNKGLREEAERWLQTAAINVEAVATHYTTTELGNSMAIHILPAAIEGSGNNKGSSGGGNSQLVAERASYLRDTQPRCVHVVIQGNAIAVSVNTEHLPDVEAGKVLRGLLRELPGKGGGQNMLAQGRLKTAITESSQISHL